MRSLLIVGDSNQKFIHENVLYSELSVDKVVTGSVDPKNRGYCSERSWINAKFREQNLEEQVPKLLEQTNFNLLVIQSPTNDISNLKGEKHAKLLAKKSSTTTLRIAKESLDSFKSLVWYWSVFFWNLNSCVIQIKNIATMLSLHSLPITSCTPYNHKVSPI